MLTPTADIFGHNKRSAKSAFWLRIFNDPQLNDCHDLEKLLAGCEIIAALDGVDLLAA